MDLKKIEISLLYNNEKHSMIWYSEHHWFNIKIEKFWIRI